MADKETEKKKRNRRTSLRDLENTMRIGRVPVQQAGDLVGLWNSTMDRLLHHGHVLKCGPRSWRTKTGLPGTGSKG